MQVNWEPEERTSCGVRTEAVPGGKEQEEQPGPRDVWHCALVCQRVCRCSCVGIKPFSNVFKPLLIYNFFPLMKSVLLFLLPSAKF